MTDQELEQTLAAARRAGSGWSSRRELQSKWAVMRRLEPRRWRPLLALAVGSAAVAAVGVIGRRTLIPAAPTATSTAATASAASRGTFAQLADGSSIVLDGPSTILRKTIEGTDDVLFELESGGAHFEVARRPSRTFRVHAGPVTVQVIGTRFRMQRQDATSSRVSVDRGRVLVSWWGGSRELGPGEAGTFPPAPDVDPSAAPAPKTAAPERATPAGAAAPARHGTAPGPTELFARADRARRQGRPEAAVAELRQIVERHPGDPLSPMAAFTIGRLQLESLGQPRQAALAFGQARVLARDGPLAEDALAREVQALAAAGDLAAARRRAELYRQLFPRGPRLSTVMRFGGLRAAP